MNIESILPQPPIYRKFGKYIRFRTKDDKYGILDEEGHLIICPNYDCIIAIKQINCDLITGTFIDECYGQNCIIAFSDPFAPFKTHDETSVWMDGENIDSDFFFCKIGKEFEVFNLNDRKCLFYSMGMKKCIGECMFSSSILYIKQHLTHNLYLCEDIMGNLSLQLYSEDLGFKEKCRVVDNFKKYKDNYISFVTEADEDGYEYQCLFKITQDASGNGNLTFIESFMQHISLTQTKNSNEFIIEDCERSYIIRIVYDATGNKQKLTKVTTLYNKINSRDDGLYDILENRKYGLMDSNYNVIVTPKFDYPLAYGFGSEPFSYIESLIGESGLIDNYGNIVIPPIYDFIHIYNQKGHFKIYTEEFFNGEFYLEPNTGIYDKNGHSNGIILGVKEKLISFDPSDNCTLYSLAGKEQATFNTLKNNDFFYDPGENYLFTYESTLLDDRNRAVYRNVSFVFIDTVKTPVFEQAIYIGNNRVLYLDKGKLSMIECVTQDIKKISEFDKYKYNFCTIPYDGFIAAFSIISNEIRCSIYETSDRIELAKHFIFHVNSDNVSRENIILKLGTDYMEMQEWVNRILSEDKAITFPAIPTHSIDEDVEQGWGDDDPDDSIG